MRTLNQEWHEQILKQMSACRNGKIDSKALPLMAVGHDLKKKGVKIAMFFTNKMKKPKRARQEGADKKQNGVTSPVVVSEALAAFLNKHFSKNASGELPVSKRRIFIRGLTTSLMSRYFRNNGCLLPESDGKSEKKENRKNSYIRPNAELMELFDITVDVKQPNGQMRKGKVFDVEEVGRDGFGYTQLQKLLKYHYPKMTKVEREEWFAKSNMDEEKARLAKIREESTAETTAFNQDKKSRLKAARQAAAGSKPTTKRGRKAGTSGTTTSGPAPDLKAPTGPPTKTKPVASPNRKKSASPARVNK